MSIETDKGSDVPSSVVAPAASLSASAWHEVPDDSLSETVRVLHKRMWGILVCGVVGLVLAAMICMVMPKQYAATATVELNQDASQSSGSFTSIASVLTGVNDLKTRLTTASTIFQNPSIELAVIERLQLASQPDFRVLPHRAWFSRQAEPDESHLSLEQAPRTRARLLERFDNGLKVEPVTDTQLIRVRYTAHSAEQAARIANAVVDEYKRQYLRSHYNSSQEVSQWLTEQLSSLKDQMEGSEKRLADFQRTTGILGIEQLSDSADNKGGGGFFSPVLQKLTTLNGELTNAEVNRVSKEAIYRLVGTGDARAVAELSNSALLQDRSSLVVTQGGGLTALLGLEEQRSAAAIEYAQLAPKLGAKNPHLLDLKSRLDALDAQINLELKKIKERARSDFELAQKVEGGVRQQYEQQQQLAAKVSDQAVQFGVLRQEAESNAHLYEGLFTKLQEANISAGVNASNVTVVDPARPVMDAVAPKVPLLMAIGLGAGVFFGLAGAFTLEALDRSVVSIEQVESISQRPVLAVIPQANNGGGYYKKYGYYSRTHPRKPSSEAEAALKGPLWMVAAPESAVAEACRALRTSILFSKAGAPPRTLAVTSSMAGEGKSTLSLNLAAAFAQQGSRVLLIEADMRRPGVAKMLSMEHATGLSNILTGSADLASARVRFPEVPGLSLLLAGPPPPMPSELLSSTRLTSLLQTALASYDFVILDTPPATLVTDAVLISHQVEGLVCIVRAHVATRPGLLRFSDLLRKNHCPVLGYVLNAVNTRSTDYSHYYGYSGNSNYYHEAQD